MSIRVLFAGLLLACPTLAADAPMTRHGVQPDLKSFPQATPKEALASVIKAADLKRHDYLLAQLADPDWVDARVEVLADGFKDALKEVSVKFDPPAIKQLKRLLDEGEVETLDTSAVVRHKEVSDRVVRLRKINKRWYLQHSNRP
jgi:hypothetical protein